MNKVLPGLIIFLGLVVSQVSAQTGGGSFASTVPLVRPDSAQWQAGAGFDFALGKKKNLKLRQSVSGISCLSGNHAQQLCLLVFDEGVQARYATLTDGQVQPEREVLQFPGLTGELDAEGAATDGRYVYITGSHSAKRSDCASNPDSRYVIRAPLNAQRTRVDVAAAVSTGQLWTLLLDHPELRTLVGENKCLGTEPAPKAPRMRGQYGLNIEGLAVRDGQLHFGLRGPVPGGQALVFSVPAERLFATGVANAAPTPIQLARLDLGAQRGVRDMVAVQDGILLLAGPDDDERNKDAGWVVFWWDGRTGQGATGLRPLARLDLSQVKLRDCDSHPKPEAMTVLSANSTSYRLLVLSDGLCDGGALSFTVPR